MRAALADLQTLDRATSSGCAAQRNFGGPLRPPEAYATYSGLDVQTGQAMVRAQHGFVGGYGRQWSTAWIGITSASWSWFSRDHQAHRRSRTPARSGISRTRAFSLGGTLEIANLIGCLSQKARQSSGNRADFGDPNEPKFR